MRTQARTLIDSSPAYRTALGEAHRDDGHRVLRQLEAGSVNLVLTSPPFPLRRQKEYGNPDPAAYIDWFVPFAQEVHRVLRHDGSFVMEIGGGWERRQATRSLVPYRLLLRLCERFHLAQDFYWFNPSKLPTPAEWVTIHRTRVKEAVTQLWWLSKSIAPAADNRRVLAPYSRSMRRLLRDGYATGRRPSQHVTSPHYRKDNGGAIPGNLLSAANTRSNEGYLRRCRRAGVRPHPARFVEEVPEFFVRFLTEPGDLVVDPFAGSNMVGYVAEKLGRRWLSVEAVAEYVRGSKLRFKP